MKPQSPACMWPGSLQTFPRFLDRACPRAAGDAEAGPVRSSASGRSGILARTGPAAPGGGGCLARPRRKRRDPAGRGSAPPCALPPPKPGSWADPLLTRGGRARPRALVHAASGEMDIQAGRFLAARLLGSLFQNSPWSTDCSLSSSSLVPGGIPVSQPKSFPFLLIMGKEYASGR